MVLLVLVSHVQNILMVCGQVISSKQETSISLILQAASHSYYLQVVAPPNYHPQLATNSI